MLQKIIIGLIVLLTITITSIPAQEPPTPQEVANTVSNYWIGQNFTNLNSYITNLYVAQSNYVPAILASVFHDSTYLGKLSQATNKLARVQTCVTNNPQNFSAEFKDLLIELKSDIDGEIALHARKGRSPATVESNASPQTVRSTWGTTLLPEINILFYAPATNAP